MGQLGTNQTSTIDCPIDDSYFDLDGLFLDIPFLSDLPTDEELKETLECLEAPPDLESLFPAGRGEETFTGLGGVSFPHQNASISLPGTEPNLQWTDVPLQSSAQDGGWLANLGMPFPFDGGCGESSKMPHRRKPDTSGKRGHDYVFNERLRPNSNQMKKSFRGVSRHRLTQRWEASLWLNGKQLYLGGFNIQEDAARAYDLAALACKGSKASTNFSVSEYTAQLNELKGYSEEEVVAYIRRRSTAFSRGKSKFRGVSGQTGRWEARIGSFRGKKNVSFGIFATEEEAARQYDRALVCERGRSAKTNFPVDDYIQEAREAAPFGRTTTLPLGRQVTQEESRRGITITVEALVEALSGQSGNKKHTTDS